LAASIIAGNYNSSIYFYFMKFTFDSLDFIFGSFLVGKSFSESMTFDVTEDDLFYVVLFIACFVDIYELKRF